MFITLLIAFGTLINSFEIENDQNIQGAWQNDEGVMIFADNYFSYTAFSKDSFLYTYGGAWEKYKDKLILTYEFNTQSPELVGTDQKVSFKSKKNSLSVDGKNFIRIDDGSPGKLFGTWLFANRIRDDQLGTPRSADNPRKTMKILSGTRFQWIAYNTESKEFMGTGGGTYTTKDGKYTEHIDFFSRDNSRVGASLEFDYEIKGKDWHHQGLSSKGDPIYEIWTLR